MLILVALAMIATLVVVASRAEGRELSRAQTNDGGAWLVRRDIGVVGHKNRATGELSAFLAVADSPAADIHQAEDVVVVHDPVANTLVEVDVRSFGKDLQPTALPPASQVMAVDRAVVVFTESPLAVWTVPIEALPTLTDLTIEPALHTGDRGLVTAMPDGSIVVADLGAREVVWYRADGRQDRRAISMPGEVVDVTAIQASIVLLGAQGDLEVLDPFDQRRMISWGEHGDGADHLAVLQQPSLESPGSEALGPAAAVVGATPGGRLVEILLSASSPQIGRTVEIGGIAPLAPIAHQGCLHGVATEPPTFSVLCDALETRQLTGAGQELRLRLVNGWVWVNDLEDGGTWVTTDGFEIEQLDDWGLALEKLAETDDEGSAPTSSAADTLIVEDPDAVGETQNSDEFRPNDVNVPPSPTNDEVRTRVDRSVTIPVLDNDEDANNDILVVTAVELNNGEGSVAVTPRGDAVEMRPAPGFVGVAQLTYFVSDGRSEPVPALITVEVAPGDTFNSPPAAVTDVVTVAPGVTTTVDVLANDVDPDGDSIALLSISTETGTLRWDPSGLIAFTPDTTTVAGWLELPYIVVDDLGAEAEGLLRVEIRDRAANQEPDARNDLVRTVVDRPVLIRPLLNDTDPDGDRLSLSSMPKLLLSPNGVEPRLQRSDDELVFATDVPGTYLYSYRASDGAEHDTARIRVDVLPRDQNRPPVAVRDDVVVEAGGSTIARVLENDGDPDGDVIGIVDWQAVDGLIIEEFVNTAGHIGFRVTASPGAPPQSSFTYSISDGVNPPVSAVVVVATYEGQRNQPPTAVDDLIEVRRGRTVEAVSVLRNDFDPEGGSLRIVNVGGTDQAQVSISPDAQTISLSVSADARSSFTISYDIEDEAGNRAAAVVRAQLIPDAAPNRPPIARADLARTVMGVPLAVAALHNDSDPENDPIVLQGIAEQPANGLATVNSATQTVEYRPDAGFTGTDIIEYSIVDAQGAQAIGEIFVGVMAPEENNRPPVANDDSYSLGATVASTPLDVLANDFDPENDPIQIVRVTTPTVGTVLINEFGELEYSPPEQLGEPATALLTYTITDNNGNQAQATVTVTLEARNLPEPTPTPTPDPAEPEPTPTPDPTPDPVEPEVTPTPEPEPEPEENLPPVAVADEFGPVKEGTTVTLFPLENDFDPDGPRSALRLVNVGSGARIDGESVVVESGGETLQISYTIADAFDAEASATITVVVTPNQPPIIEPLLVTTEYETPIELNLAGQATDPDGDELFFVCCENIRGGTLLDVAAEPGSLALTFVPDAEFVGEGAFSYAVDDQNGNQVSGTVNVTVEAPNNREPLALDDSVQVLQGETTTFDLTRVASDPDGSSLQFTLLSPAAGGGITTELTGSTVVITADPLVEPGTAVASFVYEASDGVLSASGTVSIDVLEGANSAPTTQPANLDVVAGGSASVDLALSTFDPDVGDTLEWVVDTSAAGELTVQATGSLVQVSAPLSASGTSVVLAWSVSDSRGEQSQSELLIQISEPQTPPPTAADDQATAPPVGSITIPVLDNDVDPLGEGLTIVNVTASQGAASISADGRGVSFVAQGFVGATSATYTIRDAANREAIGSISIDVLGVPDQPAPPEVRADSEQATLSWTAPQANGTPVTGYLLTASNGNTQTVGLQNSYTWTDLVNGEEYTFTVTAISEVGNSDPSEDSLPVTPDIVPETPAVPTIAFGDELLTVDWAAPVNNGSDITGYEIEIGGATSDTTAVGADTTFEWRGLTNGDEYTFRVRAENAAGFGPWSPFSNPENPEAPPGAPAIGTTVRGGLSGALTVNWTAPADDGGGQILEYRITSSAGDNVVIPAAQANSYDWADLPNGEPVEFQVEARNRAGWGPPSAFSDPVVPCGVPDAPTAVVATRGDREVGLSWQAPAANGCTITGYVITDSTGTVQNGSNTTHTFRPLDNGTSYTFRVRAVNEIGTGQQSSISNAVTPAGPPICADPSSMSATATAPRALDLSWTAAIDNGTPITVYELDAGFGFAPTAGAGTTEIIDSLSDGTQYTFSYRAVNDVGTSPVCASASATTWRLPEPLQVALSFDSTTDNLVATLSGAASPDTPLTEWNVVLNNQSTGWAEQHSERSTGSPVPLPQVQSRITQDGDYYADGWACNAVGCVSSGGQTTCCLTITLASPPDAPLAPTVTNSSHDLYLNVDTFASWDPPADNGAPILEYEYRHRYMGSSGNWHDGGTSSTTSTSNLYLRTFWIYTTHPDTPNGGSAMTVSAAVRARNSEGWGAWSDWGEVTPNLSQPSLILDTSLGFSCGTLPSGSQCAAVATGIYGFGASRSYLAEVLVNNAVACSTTIFTDGQGHYWGPVCDTVVTTGDTLYVRYGQFTTETRFY